MISFWLSMPQCSRIFLHASWFVIAFKQETGILTFSRNPLSKKNFRRIKNWRIVGTLQNSYKIWMSSFYLLPFRPEAYPNNCKTFKSCFTIKTQSLDYWELFMYTEILAVYYFLYTKLHNITLHVKYNVVKESVFYALVWFTTSIMCLTQ